MKPVMEEIEALVARVGTHPVYGYAHCLRVYALAEELAALEEVSYDTEILRAAALLHDVGLYKAYARREPADHAKRSALVARRILQDWDFPPQASQAVIEAIERHPPGVPGSAASETILLKDAIGLDYLGAIGVSRMLAMVGTEDDVPGHTDGHLERGEPAAEDPRPPRPAEQQGPGRPPHPRDGRLLRRPEGRHAGMKLL